MIKTSRRRAGVKRRPTEKERDLKVFQDRKHEAPIPYEDVLRDMKRRGLR